MIDPFDAPDERALVALAAHGLAGSLFEVPAGPFAPDEWFHLVATCRAFGLIGSLSLATQRGDVNLTEAQVEELGVLETETAGLALLIEQRVVRVSGLLTAAGVAHRLVGGPARSRLGYRHSGVRSFDSATLLVEPRGLNVATPVRGVLLQQSLPLAEGVIIELAHCAEPATLLALAEQPVPTLSLEEHLVMACLEATNHRGVPGARPNLVLERDVAELALYPGIDAARVQFVAEGWGAVELVAGALANTWALFELADRTRLSVWAARVVDPPTGRRGGRQRIRRQS